MYVKTQSEVLQMWEFSELWKRMEIFWVDSNSDSMLWVSKESIHGSRFYLLSGYTSLRMNKVSQSPCLNGVTLQLSNEVWISFFSTLHRLFSCVLVHLACKVILILFGNISRIESLCVCVWVWGKESTPDCCSHHLLCENLSRVNCTVPINESILLTFILLY